MRRVPPTARDERPARTRVDRLLGELAELGPQVPLVRLGDDAASDGPLPCLATGVAPIDQMLGGGFPRGRLSEVAGPASSGRTSLALSLLAALTRSGECAAWVDRADAFDPLSAADAGVALQRVLWVRPRGGPETLRCTERLLETDGLPLVLLDLTTRDARRGERPDDARTWLRLSRLATGTGSALVVLSPERITGSQAQIALELQPGRPVFTGAPLLLEELRTQAVLVRHRAAPTGGTAALQFGGGEPGARAA